VGQITKQSLFGAKVVVGMRMFITVLYGILMALFLNIVGELGIMQRST
jgi:hypothetical protein